MTLAPRPVRLEGNRSHGEHWETITFPMAPTAAAGGATSELQEHEESALAALTEEARCVHCLPGDAQSLGELAQHWGENHQAKRLAIHRAESWLLELLGQTPQSVDATETVAVELRVLLALAAEALR